MKEIFKGCLFSILLTAGIILSFIIFVMVLIQCEMRTPASDKEYIRILENFTNQELPSCKIVTKKYRKNSYIEVVVFKLNEDDYVKALKGIQSDADFKADPDFKFMELTNKLIEKENIKKNSLDYIYYGGYWRFGFKSPNIIIYEGVLYD